MATVKLERKDSLTQEARLGPYRENGDLLHPDLKEIEAFMISWDSFSERMKRRANWSVMAVVAGLAFISGIMAYSQVTAYTSGADLSISSASTESESVSEPEWFERIVESSKAATIAEPVSNARLLKLEVPQLADAINVGSQVIVAEWEWVDGTRGESCGIQFGGRLTVIEIADLLKVEYEYLGDTGGTPCESGVQFHISAEAFRSMSPSYIQLRDESLRRQAIISEILRQSHNGNIARGAKQAVTEHRWVESVIDHAGREDAVTEYLPGRGSCSIKEGGEIQKLGDLRGISLYEYSISRDTGGALCPSGTLFIEVVN